MKKEYDFPFWIKFSLFLGPFLTVFGVTGMLFPGLNAILLYVSSVIIGGLLGYATELLLKHFFTP
jgi:hypothetical protein